MIIIFSVIYLPVFFLLNNMNLFAQNDNLIFEQLNTSHGLSNNVVQVIYQDSKDYLWVGTADGLNRYNGYKFTTYRYDSQDTNSISNNNIWAINEDKFGNLWIGTDDGLNFYDREKESFTTFRYNPPSTSTVQTSRWHNSVIGIHEDSNENLWLGTVFNGLTKFDRETKKFTHYLLDSAITEGSFPNTIFRIISDRKVEGRLWLANWNTGLASFNIEKEQFKIYRHNPKQKFSLSNDEIRSLYQDRSGIIWVGTQGGGLNMFDPDKEQFTHFKHEPDNPASLSNDVVGKIFESQDESGILWIGTEGGLNKFDTKSNSFSIYKSDVNDKGTLSNDIVHEIYEDKSGVMWIGTNGGLNKVDPGRVPFHHYKSVAGRKNGLNSNEIYAITKSAIKDDILWIGTYEGGLNKFDRKNNKFTFFKRDSLNVKSIGSDNIRSLYEDPDEAGEILWIGTANAGLNKFDVKNNSFKKYKYNSSDPTTISSNLIRQIYETRDGMLWLTTSGGLNKFDRKKEIFKRYLLQDTTYTRVIQDLLQKFSTEQSPISSILKVKDDENITKQFEVKKKTKVLAVSLGEGNSTMWDYGWLENADGKEIWKLELEESKHAGGADKNRMQIWTGTLEAGTYNLRYVSDESHSFDSWNTPAPINSNWWGIQLFEISEKENNLILQNIDKFEKPNSIVQGNTNAIIEDLYGMLWIGTQSMGLSKLDRKTGLFTNYASDPANPNSLSNNFIRSLLVDKNGVLWIGTRDGLNRYDSKNNSFKAYFTEDGLPNNVIINILEDTDGSLWLATNNGISKFNPDDEKKHGYLTFINYNIQDGLPYDQYVQGSMHSAANGEMYFGGIGGFVSFVPGKSNQHPPRTLISEFQLFNQKVIPGEDSPLQKHISETKQINLSFNQNVFSFEFTALHFSRPEKNLYLYKMEGFDKEWIDGSRRFAPYTNLDPGEYTFRVKAANSDGVWNEEVASVKITIHPPWWQTTLAYFGYGFAIIGIIFGIDRLQRRRLLAKAKERMKYQEVEHRAETAELQAKAAEAQALVVQAENDRKSQELEEARQLQLSMLPRDLPHLPNLDIAVYMKTATEVGGDYYDFHVGMDGVLTVVVGDATGHGMKAGTMVTTTKSLFNVLAPNPNIVETFHEMTRCLKLMHLEKLSMCMTMLKIRENKIEMSAAGMPPVFLYKRDSQSIEEHVMKGMPLGTFKDFPYTIKETELNAGDTLLLMSDGFPELMNEKKELYGYKRTRNLFEEAAEKSPEEIINILKNEVSNWMNNNDPDDDVTFVVIKVK